MVNIFQFKKFNFKMQLIDLILILNCPVVPNLSNGTLGKSISLTYLRGLEVPVLTEGDMPVINLKNCNRIYW